MYAQVACVAEQAWILHKGCSVDKDKLCLRSDEPTKWGEKHIFGWVSLKAGRECVKITTPDSL